MEIERNFCKFEQVKYPTKVALGNNCWQELDIGKYMKFQTIIGYDTPFYIYKKLNNNFEIKKTFLRVPDLTMNGEYIFKILTLQKLW